MGNIEKLTYPSTHCGIVRAATVLLKLENHPAADRYDAGTVETMVEEASAPDRMGDRLQGSGLHYYCSVTPEGVMRTVRGYEGIFPNSLGDLAPSPLTMMTSEYITAIALERLGNRCAAAKCLARAAHMLADVCCPPHSAGLSYYSRYASNHKRYESDGETYFWNEKFGTDDPVTAAEKWAALCVGQVPYEKYESLLKGDPDGDLFRKMSRFPDICREIALSGAGELPSVLSNDQELRRQSIDRRLILSVVHTAALFAAFDRDVRDESIRVPQERIPYRLYSFGAGKTLFREPLYVRFTEDGSIELLTQEGAYLAVTRFGSVRLTDQTAGMTTRFRFGFEPMMTLYPNGDIYHLLAVIGKRFCSIRRGLHKRSPHFSRQTGFRLDAAD